MKTATFALAAVIASGATATLAADPVREMSFPRLSLLAFACQVQAAHHLAVVHVPQDADSTFLPPIPAALFTVPGLTKFISTVARSAVDGEPLGIIDASYFPALDRVDFYYPEDRASAPLVAADCGTPVS